MPKCEQELCPNWSGDGNVCPCAVLDLERPTTTCGLQGDEGATCSETRGHRGSHSGIGDDGQLYVWY